MPLSTLVSAIASASLLLGASDSVKTPESARAKRPAVSGRPGRAARAAFSAESLVVEKAARKLTIYAGGAVVRTYRIALGRDPVGTKLRQGDGRTPEGLYRIEAHNPASKYHLALRISYPNARDRARAAKLGVPPGGDIMIHGLPRAFSHYGAEHRKTDWTEGCVALTNEEIEELFAAVPVGTPIEIKP